jgi:hypothetical protein
MRWALGGTHLQAALAAVGRQHLAEPAITYPATIIQMLGS